MLKRIVILLLVCSFFSAPAFCKTKKIPAKSKTKAADAASSMTSTAASKSSLPADPGPEYLAKFTGSPGYKINHSFKSGFESMDDFKDFYVTPAKSSNSDQKISGEVVHGGVSAYKAWITGPNDVSGTADNAHMAYPAVQMYKTTGTFYGIIFTEIWVWVDAALSPGPGTEWFSLASFCPYSDDTWQRSININLNKDGVLQLANVPEQQQAVDDIYQTSDIKFPAKQWVKLDALMDFGADNEYKSPYIKVWQDEKLVSAARFNPHIAPSPLDPTSWPPCLDGWDGQNVDEAERLCGLIFEGGLAQAHFGLNAAAQLSTGTVYNDDLIICEISK